MSEQEVSQENIAQQTALKEASKGLGRKRFLKILAGTPFILGALAACGQPLGTSSPSLPEATPQSTDPKEDNLIIQTRLSIFAILFHPKGLRRNTILKYLMQTLQTLILLSFL